MTPSTPNCPTPNCPLTPILDGLLDQLDALQRLANVLWDNTTRLAALVTMRNCPPECPISIKTRKTLRPRMPQETRSPGP
jgi:hypothetical protein